MIKMIRVVPVITAGAYGANDNVGGLLTLPTGRRGKGGTILSLSIFDKAQQAAVLQFFLFNRIITSVADNDPFNIADADSEKLIGQFAVAATDYLSVGTEESIGMVRNLNIPFKLPKGLTNLYFTVRSTAIVTYASVSDLSFVFALDME